MGGKYDASQKSLNFEGHITYPCPFHLAGKYCFMIDLIILVDLGDCCKIQRRVYYELPLHRECQAHQSTVVFSRT